MDILIIESAPGLTINGNPFSNEFLWIVLNFYIFLFGCKYMFFTNIIAMYCRQRGNA